MLKSYEYTKNNIELRIVSSQIMADYKQMQADNLDEMLNGKHPFPQGTREIFLLKLDIWYRFLLMVEKYLIKEHTPTLTNKQLIHILDLAEVAFNKYNTTIKDNPNEFNHKIFPLWTKIHTPLFECFINYIKMQVNKKTFYALDNIGKKLIKILRGTLFELFEIDSLEKGKKPFLVFGNIEYDLLKAKSLNLIKFRLQEYKLKYNIEEIYIKNFCDETVPQSVLKDLENIIKIDFYTSFSGKII